LTVVGIVAAGGSGERLGAEGPKAFVVLGGRTLLDWALDALRPACGRVVAAVPAGHEEPPDRVAGGASRSVSVRNALEAAPEATVAVVHDAARPLARTELVKRCVDALEPGIDGAIAAAPMTDTVKEAGGDRRVKRTLDRSALWAVQTPQAFRADALRRALDVGDDALAAATDDASLVEAAGGSVRVVEAPAENLKVTRPADLRVAEALLAA
jgi:2-C-methyl-D-erythritol 4-phosphate cytidylyltransferase